MYLLYLRLRLLAKCWAIVMGNTSGPDRSAQFKGPLKPSGVKLRRIGWRVVATDGMRTVMSVVHVSSEPAEACRDKGLEAGLRAYIVPAYDWRDFLYATLRSDTSEEEDV